MGRRESLVKQDINFLEYPLWFPFQDLAERKGEGWVYETRDGFIYKSSYKIPTRIDVLFLMYFLYQSQRKGWKEEVNVSRYQILKDCGIAIGGNKYERLKDSLKRWTSITVIFEGTFYDGKKYISMGFHVIDSYKIRENGTIEVKFNSDWLLKIKESLFYKYLDFNTYKKLSHAEALRLYEILCKTFKNRKKWEIDAVKLAQKIPLTGNALKYPSKAVEKIEPLVKRINKDTPLKVRMRKKRLGRGKIVLLFQRLSEEEYEEYEAELEMERLCGEWIFELGSVKRRVKIYRGEDGTYYWEEGKLRPEVFERNATEAYRRIRVLIEIGKLKKEW